MGVCDLRSQYNTQSRNKLFQINFDASSTIRNTCYTSPWYKFALAGCLDNVDLGCTISVVNKVIRCATNVCK